MEDLVGGSVVGAGAVPVPDEGHVEATPGTVAWIILQVILFVPVLFFNLVPDFRFAPLGRAAPLSLCGLLAVLTGIVDEKEAFQKAIDHGTLVFLIGMMILAAYLEKKQILERLADVMFKNRKPYTLLIMTSLFSGVFAAIITNDGVCMLITPIIVKTVLERNLDPFPFLMAICTSANVGSGATLSGNPQNILIGHLSKVYLRHEITWLEFLALSLPAAVVGLLLNTGFLLVFYRNSIREGGIPFMYEQIAFKKPEVPETVKERVVRYVEYGLTAFIMTSIIICFGLGLSVEIVAFVGALLLLIVSTIFQQDGEPAKEMFRAVQWDVIIVFSSLFIVVHAFNLTKLPNKLWVLCYPVMQGPGYGVAFFSAVLILLSTLVSNVPVVLMVAPEMGSKLAWIILAWAITVGGNFTLISSAANIIVDEKANSVNPRLRLDAWKYFKFGFPATAAVTLIGVYIIVAVGKLYGYPLQL